MYVFRLYLQLFIPEKYNEELTEQVRHLQQENAGNLIA